MTDFDETNRGVLFLETDKESEKHPDYTGKVNVEGKEYRLAGWKRQSKNGKGFLSLSISEFKKPEDPTDKFEGYKEDSGKIDLKDIPF